MPAPDFVFLNGQAVRATSLTPLDEGGFRLVVIARGGADRDQLTELLHAPDLQVRVGAGETQPMHATEIDVRSVGEGPQAIHRIETVLAPGATEASAAAEPDSTAPGDALSPLQQRLDTIIGLLTEIRDELKRRPTP